MKSKWLLLICILCFSLSEPASAQSATPMRVNSQRIMQHLQTLAEFGKNPQGGVSRSLTQSLTGRAANMPRA